MACSPPQVWLSAELDAAGSVQLAADSDAVLSRGFAAVVVATLSGMRPDALLAADLDALFGELGLDAASLTPSRTNGFLNLLEAVRKRVRMLTTALPSFPSLLIKHDGITAQVRLLFQLIWMEYKLTVPYGSRKPFSVALGARARHVLLTNISWHCACRERLRRRRRCTCTLSSVRCRSWQPSWRLPRWESWRTSTWTRRHASDYGC